VVKIRRNSTIAQFKLDRYKEMIRDWGDLLILTWCGIILKKALFLHCI